MNEHDPDGAETARLSEEAAHRLLLRAIELEHSRGSETTVNELREVAREAGISVHAFDEAFREFGIQAAMVGPAPAPTEARGFLGRLWNRMRGHADRRTIGDAVVSNAIAAGLSWVSLALLTRMTHGFGWQAMESTTLVAFVLGVGIARRLHARLVELGLMGMVAFQAAEFAMHLLFGIRAVQGGPTHFAVMIAGVLGAAIGWGMRGKHLGPADPVGAVADAPSTVASGHTPRRAPPEPERYTRSVQVGSRLGGTSFAHHAPAG